MENNLQFFYASYLEIVVFCLCSYSNVKYVQTTLCSLVFGDMGYLLGPYIEKAYLQDESQVFVKMAWGGVFGFLITVAIILCAYNDSVLVYINQNGNKPYF